MAKSFLSLLLLGWRLRLANWVLGVALRIFNFLLGKTPRGYHVSGLDVWETLGGEKHRWLGRTDILLAQGLDKLFRAGWRL